MSYICGVMSSYVIVILTSGDMGEKINKEFSSVALLFRYTLAMRKRYRPEQPATMAGAGKLRLALLNMANKEIAITGGSKVSDILTFFGKVIDNSKRSVLIRLDYTTSLSMVAQQVQANKEDKDKALAALTLKEQAAVLKYFAAIQGEVDKRKTSDKVERWSIKGIATLG